MCILYFIFGTELGHVRLSKGNNIRVIGWQLNMTLNDLREEFLSFARYYKNGTLERSSRIWQKIC